MFYSLLQDVNVVNEKFESQFTLAMFCLVSESEYELYKNTDIRPPFTYATLIRQVQSVLLNFKHIKAANT